MENKKTSGVAPGQDLDPWPGPWALSPSAFKKGKKTLGVGRETQGLRVLGADVQTQGLMASGAHTQTQGCWAKVNVVVLLPEARNDH
jgi:hypothetical protein